MSKFQLKLVTDKKPRSNFNMSFVTRFTTNPMLAVPVACLDTIPDDTFITQIENRITTDSLLSPALANFRVSFHEFFVPMRLYSKELATNSVNVSGGSLFSRDFALPQFDWPPIEGETYMDFQIADLDKFAVKSCSLADMLYAPVGFLNMTRNPIAMNALPALAYYDIIRNYFCHQQAGYVPIVSPVGREDGSFDTVATPVELFQLDDVFDQARNNNWQAQSFADPSATCFVPFGGLACTTFMPDQFVNYLSNEQVARIEQLVKIGVDTLGEREFITVDEIRYANKFQRYLELSILGGNSRYSDWLHAHWGVEVDPGTFRPEYLGTTTSWVKFGEVISTSNTLAPAGESITGLGDRGGVGFGAGRSKKRRYNFKENGVYMVIMTIVPEIDYAQGISKSVLKTRFSDLYVPSLDGLGFQDIAMSELNALPNRAVFRGVNTTFYQYVAQNSGGSLAEGDANPFEISIGKQPAWMEYMTKQNELHGRLVPSGDLGYWALSRTFFATLRDGQADPADRDPLTYDEVDTIYRWTPYGYPWEFNYLFNNTDRYAQNFICEVKFDIVVKRQKSKNIRPTL